MNLATDTCVHCGDPLALRHDRRGRKARFCSDACRSAAYRERKKREHADELEQARTQMAIDLEPKRYTSAYVIADLLESFHGYVTGGPTPPSGYEEVFRAAQRLIDTPGERWWPQGAKKRVRALEERVADLEVHLMREANTPEVPTFVRRERPGLHKKAKKKRRR